MAVTERTITDDLDLEALSRDHIRERLAIQLFEGTLRTYDIAHGSGGFALDLRTRRCELCGGAFPREGWAKGAFAREGFVVFHRGCANECDNWTIAR